MTISQCDAMIFFFRMKTEISAATSVRRLAQAHAQTHTNAPGYDVFITMLLQIAAQCTHRLGGLIHSERGCWTSVELESVWGARGRHSHSQQPGLVGELSQLPKDYAAQMSEIKGRGKHTRSGNTWHLPPAAVALLTTLFFKSADL